MTAALLSGRVSTACTDGIRVTVESTLRALTEVWRGDSSWQQAVRSGALALHGEAQARRAFPQWLKLSSTAAVPRPAVAR